MVKLVVLYNHPTDPAAFEQYYRDVHFPIAMQMQGVARVELTKCAPGPDGSAPAFYRIAELYFDSDAQLEKTMSSPEGQATVADLANFATGGVTVITGPVEVPGAGVEGAAGA